VDAAPCASRGGGRRSSREKAKNIVPELPNTCVFVGALRLFVLVPRFRDRRISPARLRIDAGMSVTPPPPEELNRELDVLLATEDNTVREEAASLLAKNNARVASERLTGTNPNGEPLYDGETKTIDGHTITTSATPPLRKLLSTPALPEELVKHLPVVEDDPQ
jgi:hypothetical protein